MIRSHVPSLLCAAISIALLLGAFGCGGEECDFNGATRDEGGIGLVDCGIAGDDPASVDRCAVMAYGDGATFRAIYPTDEGGLEAIVHGDADQFALLRTPAPGGVVERAECADAEVVTQGGRTRVNCVNPGPFAVVCE